MKAILYQLKFKVFKPVLSFFMACKAKMIAILGLKRPARSCQLPAIRQMIEAHTNGPCQGFFVEVGAFDGERFSNTSWLADNGWQGLYIEPSPTYARLCRSRHVWNRVNIVNCAAGARDEEMTLMEIGALSTLSMDTLDSYLQIEWSARQVGKHFARMQVPLRRLDRLLEEYSVSPGFDLLVVDVEGFEEEVFAGFSLDAWRPKLLIAELCDRHPELSTIPSQVEPARRVRKQILAAGYEEIHADSINSVFLRADESMRQ